VDIKMDVEKIASVCHEANRAYCRSIGDISHMPWTLAEQWQRDSAIDGVEKHLKSPMGPGASHEAWLDFKLNDGWKHGPTKDENLKTHPSMVPYEDLPESEKLKDVLFAAVVEALRPNE